MPPFLAGEPYRVLVCDLTGRQQLGELLLAGMRGCEMHLFYVQNALTESEASYVMVWGTYMAFSGWSWVRNRGKKYIRTLAVIDEVLTILRNHC